eukprot:TRINITY_DN69902_c0_g1_i1.p1 TRINITY_DN69902_c0_g1~~TRINITY_DN69902_c0_g1_i1.p1  ORF type:complete len:458 (-),score=5.61 TRINITY_DN69902_c0_g1_i1:25-1398(-)
MPTQHSHLLLLPSEVIELILYFVQSGQLCITCRRLVREFPRPLWLADIDRRSLHDTVRALDSPPALSGWPWFVKYRIRHDWVMQIKQMKYPHNVHRLRAMTSEPADVTADGYQHLFEIIRTKMPALQSLFMSLPRSRMHDVPGLASTNFLENKPELITLELAMWWEHVTQDGFDFTALTQLPNLRLCTITDMSDFGGNAKDIVPHLPGAHLHTLNLVLSAPPDIPNHRLFTPSALPALCNIGMLFRSNGSCTELHTFFEDIPLRTQLKSVCLHFNNIRMTSAHCDTFKSVHSINEEMPNQQCKLEVQMYDGHWNDGPYGGWGDVLTSLTICDQNTSGDETASALLACIGAAGQCMKSITFGLQPLKWRGMCGKDFLQSLQEVLPRAQGLKELYIPHMPAKGALPRELRRVVNGALPSGCKVFWGVEDVIGRVGLEGPRSPWWSYVWPPNHGYIANLR